MRSVVVSVSTIAVLASLLSFAACLCFAGDSAVGDVMLPLAFFGSQLLLLSLLLLVAQLLLWIYCCQLPFYVRDILIRTFYNFLMNILHVFQPQLPTTR